MRKLTLVICAIAVVFALSTIASAEVQSIKVSGEINTYAIYRTADGTLNYYGTGDERQYLETVIGLNFDADLTENVGAHLTLVNERDWDRQSQSSTAFDVGVAQAYITLKQMLYEPLTIKIGTMPLYYGRGFMIGYNPQNVDPESSITADEYGLYGTFDAITATLDYAPWTIDLAYVKADENYVHLNDDHNLYIANVGYDFASKQAEAEGYLMLDTTGHATANTHTDNIYTAGLRGSMAPVDNSLVYGEFAYQFGDYARSANHKVDVDAYGGEVGGEYTWANVLTTPKIGLLYSYLTGEKTSPSNTDDYEQFTATFSRRSDTAIYGWNGRLYNTAEGNDDPANTNMQKILVTGSLQPLAAMGNKDVNLEAKYAHFEFVERPAAGQDKTAGDELDLNLTYDYTEDVQFGLLSAWFWPGDYYKDASSDYDKTVTDIVGSCKVTF